MPLLPSSSNTDADDATPRVIGVDSEDADALLGALSSETARRVLTALHDEPAPPSALADRIGTSLQNVQYHLARLKSAGAIAVVDTIYSEKGREMKIYAPADKPLVIFAGREQETGGLKSAIARLFSGVAVLAGASLVVETWASRRGVPVGGTETTTQATTTTAESGGGFSIAEATAQTVAETTTQTASNAAAFTTEAANVTDLPPGALFFAGGALVLLTWATVAYTR